MPYLPDDSVSQAAGLASQPDMSQVPQFAAPVNPATPIHHGFLGRIGAALGSAGNAVGNSMNPTPDAMQGLLSPSDQQHARSASWLALGNSLLNPTLDARGFKQSFLGSAASGLQAGQQASQGSIGNALQAAQYATGVSQQKRLVEGRQQIASQFAWNPNDDQSTQLQKLDGSAQAYLGLGDYHAAEAAAQAAKSLRESRTAAAGNSPYSQINAGDLHTVFRKADGMYLQRDGKTWAPFIDVGETPFHAQETWARQNTADVNAATHRQSTYMTQYVKPSQKAAGSIASWNAVAPLAATTPEATKAAITAFVGAMEPNVQLRYATLQYLSNVDPSLAGSLKRMISTGQYGTLPASQIAQMNNVVQSKSAVYKNQYNALRAKGLTAYPEQSAIAPQWEDLTGASQAGAPAAQASAPPAAGVNPYRKKP